MPSAGGTRPAAWRSPPLPRPLGLGPLCWPASAQEVGPRLAEPGGCTMVDRAAVRDWRIGCRTWGWLNAERDQSVLFTTWLTGTSGALADSIGPGSLADARRLHVIAVTALQLRVPGAVEAPRVHDPRAGRYAAADARGDAEGPVAAGRDGDLQGRHVDVPLDGLGS